MLEQRGEISAYEEALARGGPFAKPFAPYWGAEHWTKWATVREIFRRLRVAPPATVLDIGCGEGWTSLFLADAGYRVTGVDFAPAAIAIARERSERWRTVEPVAFEVADMERLNLGRAFDAALVFEALHHAVNRASAVERIARHLRPGGWVVFGEPSWLHYVSPHARRVRREDGWVEKGVALAPLKRECRRVGLGEFRRFFEGTKPYESRVGEFAWQLLRLVAANVWVAPQASVWLAARKP